MVHSECCTHPKRLVCLVFLPTVSHGMDQWSQRHQRAEGAQWCLGVHGRERCGCGWAASCHHKCWWPHAATTSLDCLVQSNGTPRMDFICSLWELQSRLEVPHYRGSRRTVVGFLDSLVLAAGTRVWLLSRFHTWGIGIRSESISSSLNELVKVHKPKTLKMLSNIHCTCCPWFLPPGSRP